jgi:glycerate dehydrogenase
MLERRRGVGGTRSMVVKIICLDGYTLNPGDLSWKPFENLGELVVHDRTPAEQIIERAAGAEAVLTNKTPLTAQTLAQLPQLRYIGVLATGYNVVDVEAAAERGIAVTNVPSYGTDSVAQHAAAMMLQAARGLCAHHEAVRAGQWSRTADFCFVVSPLVELTGRTLGIVGLGRIGLALAKISAAMGMRVVAHSLDWPPAAALGGLTIERVGMDELFRQADVVSLHCPLTQENHHLVNAGRLATMKPTAILINTSRGPLIDEQALADALCAGRIAAAAVDVLEVEPPTGDSPLFSAPNCLITPHVAWAAREARARLLQQAADNLAGFQQGRPVHVVNCRVSR